MTAIITSNFRVINAENFKEDVADTANSIYVGIGKSDVWSYSLSDITDTIPFEPKDGLDDMGEAYKNMIGMKKVEAGDVSHVIPRWNWTADESYYAWDSDDSGIYDKKFYILTSEFKVYKCIKAGPSGSTQQPTQILTDPQAESDGYIWKYMYTLSVSDTEKFLTISYMPVKSVSLDFSTDQDAEAALSEGDYAQYLNQKASLESTTAAGIERIEVTEGGAGYTDGTGQSIVTITGDGTGATATADVVGGAVTAITIINKGTNYTVADIAIGGTGYDCAARAVTSPELGHGVQPTKELGGFYLALNCQLVGTEDNDLTVGNDFRQVTIVRNPKVNSSGTPGNIATSATLNALNYIQFASGTDLTSFLLDEVITGGTSLAKAFVVDIDNTNERIYYHQNSKTGYGLFTNTENITGGTSTSTGTTDGTSAQGYSEVYHGSGDIMFLENRNPINRVATQIEDIKIIIEF